MAYIRMIIGVLIAIGVLAGMLAGVQAQSDEGLVAEWHFDEGSGSVVEDSSGNGNDGELNGVVWTEGKFGSALNFNGIDDSVYSSGNSLNVNDITMEALIYPKGLIYDGYDHDMIICYTTGSYLSVLSNRGKTTSPFLCLVINGRQTCIDSGINIDNNDWYHIVGTYDGSFMKIYVNGQLKESLEISGTLTVDNDVYIGRYSIFYSKTQTYLPFNGIIDEVRIYNCALSAEEIKSHYEQGPTALSLIKTASPQSIKQGQTSSITLTVKNTGKTEITDIEVLDTIPSDQIFVDGEISKIYDFLKPKDSRQFQYVVQINEAGTYNLDPATATYADEKGNYHTVKSKPAAIEVIPSLVETNYQIQSTAGSNALTASVHLHGEKTDVVIGEDILLKLAAVNLITKPTMQVQVIITPPSGMSVTSSEFVQSGAGLFTASYEIEPGVGRDIEVKMRSNQVGDFVVNGRIVYYFGDDMDSAEDHTLTLPITVRLESEAGAGAEQTTGSGSDGSSTPGFAAVVAVIGLLTVYLRRKKI